jgi:hypothetical protein
MEMYRNIILGVYQAQKESISEMSWKDISINIIEALESGDLDVYCFH